MSFDEQWISNGIGVLMILGLMLFGFRYFWPWFTGVYWPARHARDREQYDQLVNLNDRLMTGLEESIDKLSRDLEQRTQVIIQGLANTSDGISHIQDQVRRREQNDAKLLEMAQESTMGIEGISRVVDSLKEGQEIDSRKLEQFNEIAMKVGVAYLSDRLKEKNDGPRTTDERRTDAD